MNQQGVWDNIASEWHKFKTSPSIHAQNFLKKQKGRVLDLGSGSGRNILGLKLKAKIYMVDFSKEMLKRAEKRAKEQKIKAEFKISDSAKTDYPDECFDGAICIAVLHCIETAEKREKTIKELYRVLKKGGKALIEVWNKNSKRFKNAPKEKFIAWRNKGKRYYYLYDEKEVHNLFKESGFKIISIHNSEMMINFVVEK